MHVQDFSYTVPFFCACVCVCVSCVPLAPLTRAPPPSPLYDVIGTLQCREWMTHLSVIRLPRHIL